ncbi:MAG: ABC transporter permease [Chitinophagaceae bacterium]|nr:ABC transporter permease [Chitinophagaceae bacterium]
MLKNYFKIALRNFWKNKTFSFINIFGLALGMACSLLIMLWVQDEKAMDGFFKNSERIFSVYERQYYDNKIEAFHGTPGILYDEIKKVIPEVEYASGMAWNERGTFQAGNKIMKEEGNQAGADFFKIFSYRLLQGRPSTALNTPVSIAISRKMSEDFFGSPQAAMGKTIRYENQKDFKITAVFENIPKNASRKFDFLINWEAWLDRNSWAKEWGNNGPATLIQLRAGANALLVEKKIKKFLDNYNKDQSAAFRIELGLQRYDELYLHSTFKNGKIAGGRIEYVRLFSIVAIFILLIACINFMNLTTARSVKRAREIGIRKVVGAVRSVLRRQFIGEAVLLSFFSIIISLVLVSLLLPSFNTITGKQISLPVNQSSFWLSLAGLTLITGFISGSYPAIFLSSLNPVTVLKGALKFSTGAAWFRKGLVVFQFALSTILIIGTIVVSKQVDYVQSENLGYERENLVYIPLEGDLTGKYSLFKDQALKMQGIQQVTRISQTPTQIENGTGGVQWEGKDPKTLPMFTQASVGYDFVKTMNVTILKGRDFSKNFGTDSVGYIVNEAALKKIGYKDPIGKPLTFWEKKGSIIGVVKDFHFNSLHEPINPLIIRYGEKETYGSAMVRIGSGKTKQAIAGLEKLCKQLNPQFPFTYYFSDDEYQKLYKSEQVVSKLANSFAFLAIFISCLGLLGLAMFTAEQRTREIGIRKVLGASISSLFALMSKEFMFLVCISLVIASPVAWWLMNNWLQNYAYRTPISWWVFLFAGALAVIIALVTVSFQATKAAIANPIKSLRTE